VSPPEFRSWIEELRERLANPAPRRMTPLPGKEPRRAAVLVPLFVEAGELWVVLTRRSEELPQHRGQIAFPGGGVELGEDPWQAALRETEEELGLSAKPLLRLGQLDELDSSTGFRIVPCVAAVPWPAEFKPSEAEIAEVFSVPLRALAQPQLVEEREVLVEGHRRSLRVYHVGRHQVWGLTARVLQNLLVRLGLGFASEE
jgi:8-oxo-dGTP pyrophosphatase MutT (NUDIX family)